MHIPEGRAYLSVFYGYGGKWEGESREKRLWRKRKNNGKTCDEKRIETMNICVILESAVSRL